MGSVICTVISVGNAKQRIMYEDVSSAMQLNEVVAAPQYTLHGKRHTSKWASHSLHCLYRYYIEVSLCHNQRTVGNDCPLQKLRNRHTSKWASHSLNCLYCDYVEVSLCHNQRTVGNDNSRASISQ